jgi:5-methylcytosine-specific restriction protein A
MSIGTVLNIFLEEYPKARTQNFAGHPLAEFIRKDIPGFLEEIIGPSERYFAYGSAGQGNWARVSWVAVFDRLITDTAQDGYYVVYLAKEDYSGIYISKSRGYFAA